MIAISFQPKCANDTSLYLLYMVYLFIFTATEFHYWLNRQKTAHSAWITLKQKCWWGFTVSCLLCMPSYDQKRFSTELQLKNEEDTPPNFLICDPVWLEGVQGPCRILSWIYSGKKGLMLNIFSLPKFKIIWNLISTWLISQLLNRI